MAIVGLSGSGKSTLIKLISGLYRPWSGEVHLDGVPLDRVEPRLLHNSVAVVDQEISLFGGTIRDNISMWDATMTDRAIVRAA
ncbi:ATP-binding cassette domain-containing protein, partial [Vibrio parahaemolyticus]